MRKLTDKQQSFLDVLFEEAKGDPSHAAKLAGYSHKVPVGQITSALIDEINDLTRKFIAQSSTKAVYTMYNVLDTEDMLGAKERMAAAKDLLDRAGFAKTEKVEIKAVEPIFILPSKNSDDDDDDT